MAKSKDELALELSTDRECFDWCVALSIDLANRQVESHISLTGDGERFPYKGGTAVLSPNAPPTAHSAAGLLAAMALFVQRHRAGDEDGSHVALFAAGYLSHEVGLTFDTGRSAGLAVESFAKLQAGGRKGAQTANADHVELHTEYQAAVDKLMHFGEPTGLSYGKAVPDVAKTYVVSKSTVENHTINKWPRRGGRPRKTT